MFLTELHRRTSYPVLFGTPPPGLAPGKSLALNSLANPPSSAPLYMLLGCVLAACLQHVERLVQMALPKRAFAHAQASAVDAAGPHNPSLTAPVTPPGQAVSGSTNLQQPSLITDAGTAASNPAQQQGVHICPILRKHVAVMLALPGMCKGKAQKPALGRAWNDLWQLDKQDGARDGAALPGRASSSSLRLSSGAVMTAIKECKDAYKRVGGSRPARM